MNVKYENQNTKVVMHARNTSVNFDYSNGFP